MNARCQNQDFEILLHLHLDIFTEKHLNLIPSTVFLQTESHILHAGDPDWLGIGLALCFQQDLLD